MPAAALWWRLADALSRTAAIPDRTVVDHATAQGDGFRTQALPLSVRSSRFWPPPGATLTRSPWRGHAPTPPRSRCRCLRRGHRGGRALHPELAEAIHTAATDANRHHVRITATPQLDRLSLNHLAEQITIHEPTRRGPVIVVEDAAAADPGTHSQRWPPPWSRTAASYSLTTDSSAALSDSSTDSPSPGLKTPAPQRASTIRLARADEHRAIAARSWRTLTTGPTRDRGRDRDRGHGLDID